MHDEGAEVRRVWRGTECDRGEPHMFVNKAGGNTDTRVYTFIMNSHHTFTAPEGVRGVLLDGSGRCLRSTRRRSIPVHGPHSSPYRFEN